jgi:hypothetical protein
MQVLSQATKWFKAEMGMGKDRVTDRRTACRLHKSNIPAYGYKLVKINSKRRTESTKRKRRMKNAREMIQGGWQKESFLIGRTEGTGDNLPHGWTPFPCTHCHR